MAFLRAFGCFVPGRAIGNAELAARLGCEAEWIANVSGIAERRYADPSETVAEMAVRAAEDCLAAGGVAASSIGCVMVSSGSAERRFPGPAAEIAARLGIAGAPALDLPMASAGSLFGIAMAADLAGTYGRVLVIAAEKMSAVIEGAALDRNTAILFGDGAGACVVDASEGMARIENWRIHSDGSFADNLRLDFNQPLHMDGRTVILQAARKIPAVIREVLEPDALAPADVAVFLMHQANQNLMEKVARTLEVAPGKFFSNIARYGNTSSASLLIAAAEWTAQTGFRRGDAVVFAVFGAGFHWGALLAIGS
jgi:3-oxoacyl-[acyl-carrier-protein] synthase III